MNRHLRLWLLLGASVVLASCDRPADQPRVPGPSSVAAVATRQGVGSAPAAGKPVVAPQAPGGLSVVSHVEHNFQPGVQLLAWNIRAHGLKKLTTNLLIIRDGQPQNAGEVAYQWEKWDNSQQPASGQILLLMQDGQVFDVKAKRVPLLTVDFPNLPKNTRTATTGFVAIEGDFPSFRSTTTNAGNLGDPRNSASGTTQRAVLYGGLFLPAKEGTKSRVRVSNDLNALTNASNNGRAVVAISLEWTRY